MRNGFMDRLADNLVSGPRVLLYRIVFFFCLLAPIVFMGSANYLHMHREMTDDAFDRKEALASLAATTIHERLNALVDLGISLTTRNKMIEESERGNWPEAMNRAEGVIEQFPAVDRMLLYDTNGTIMATMPALEPSVIGESRADKEWFRQVRSRSTPYVSAVTKRGSLPSINVISILIPVKAKGVDAKSASSEEGRRVFAFLQMQYRLEVFFKWLTSLDAGESGFIYIVDQKGQIIYHPKFNSEGTITDFSDVPLVQDVLKGQRGVRENYNPVEKENRVAAYEPVNEYGWGVVATQPSMLAFKDRNKDLRDILIINVVTFLLVLWLAIFILYTVALQKRSSEDVRKLMRAVEQSPATIVITDVNGKIEYVNPKFTQLTGYSLQEALGQNPRVLKSGHHSQEFYKELWDTIMAGKEWHGEFYNKKKDRDFFWENASISPVKDSQERITHFIAVKEDITSRKMMEEQLAFKAKEWEDTFNAIPDLISIHDKDFRIVRVNRAYAEFFKLKQEDLVGSLCFTVVHGTSCALKDCPHMKAMETGKPQRIEYFEPRFKLHLEISTSPIFDEQGGLSGTVHIMKNITDRKKAEGDAKKAVAVKSEFMSMVSHELRTPLGPIKEGASIILDGLVGDVNDEQRALLSIVKTNADRLHRLIDDVLDFQKLEAGRMPFNLGENSMVDAIKEVAGSMNLVAMQKQIELRVEYARDIPAIVFDRDKIIQVLTNLVNNALKFTEKGHIRIRADKEGNTVHVFVEDTGPGMKQEDIPKLFQSFQQLTGLNDRKTGGTGLGLAISKEIILRHSGKIWAESELGKGSSFHFLLPIEDRRTR